MCTPIPWRRPSSVCHGIHHVIAAVQAGHVNGDRGRGGLAVSWTESAAAASHERPLRPLNPPISGIIRSRIIKSGRRRRTYLLFRVHQQLHSTPQYPVAPPKLRGYLFVRAAVVDDNDTNHGPGLRARYTPSTGRVPFGSIICECCSSQITA